MVEQAHSGIDDRTFGYFRLVEGLWLNVSCQSGLGKGCRRCATDTGLERSGLAIGASPERSLLTSPHPFASALAWQMVKAAQWIRYSNTGYGTSTANPTGPCAFFDNVLPPVERRHDAGWWRLSDAHREMRNEKIASPFSRHASQKQVAQWFVVSKMRYPFRSHLSLRYRATQPGHTSLATTTTLSYALGALE